ncbi:hypothetical protein [Streptomyces sp. NPDC058953]|uniref:hypothetical protein n=1 Tax=Streptomyces sp. NPDC058953 TaxID=3346676 RepID=UPI0036767A3E
MNSRPTGPANGPDTHDTEARLREAMESLAGAVHAAPGAYDTARRHWRRRARRRRRVLAQGG